MGRHLHEVGWGGAGPVAWLPLLGLWPAMATAAEPTCSVTEGGTCSPTSYYWPQQKGDHGRTGFSPWAVPRNLSKGPAWHFAEIADDVSRATPLIDDRKQIYFSTVPGRLYKLSPDGALIWRKAFQFSTPMVSALLDGRIFMVSASGEVMALDMETGEEIWKSQASVSNCTCKDAASVFAFKGTVVAATLANPQDYLAGNSHVVAFHVKNGTVRWYYQPDAYVYNFQASTPGDDTIIFQDVSGGIYRLNLNTGEVIWKSGKREHPWAPSFTTGAAVSHEGQVFVVSNFAGMDPLVTGSGILHVYSVDSGALLWEKLLPYNAMQAVAVGPSGVPGHRKAAVVGVGANPGYPIRMGAEPRFGWAVGCILERASLWFPWLFAKNPAAMLSFDAMTGALIWRFELPPYRKPATAGEAERLPSRFQAVMSGENHLNDVICMPDSCSQPVIGPDGTAYQAWQDGSIYAVRDNDGNGIIDEGLGEVSSYQVSDGFQASLAMAPGILAAVPCGGGLYVFRS